MAKLWHCKIGKWQSCQMVILLNGKYVRWQSCQTAKLSNVKFLNGKVVPCQILKWQSCHKSDFQLAKLSNGKCQICKSCNMAKLSHFKVVTWKRLTCHSVFISQSVKYQSFPPSGSKNIGIRKVNFEAHNKHNSFHLCPLVFLKQSSSFFYFMDLTLWFYLETVFSWWT